MRSYFSFKTEANVSHSLIPGRYFVYMLPVYDFYQHAPFIPIVGVGKERPVTCKMAAPVTRTSLRTTGPVPADSRQ